MNELQQLVDAFKQFTDIPDEELEREEVITLIKESIEQNFSPTLVEQSINQIVNNLEDQGISKKDAQAAIDALKETFKEMLYGEQQLIGKKKEVVDMVTGKLFSIFDAAAAKYHSYSIELPIQLEDGAQVPAYAHDSDAAADMYSMEDVTIPAHFTGVPIKTGVHIQLPEGWVAFILPRSSIGAKTPLRLSNSVGVIDSGYRGEIRALYDNISDEPYQIHKGDRIVQMLVMPSYRFKANIVDSLEDSDRGEAGFGSTGV